jgi:hypothetical protein
MISGICPRPILVVCGLLSGENNLTSGNHYDSKPTVCYPKGETGKNSETAFMRWSPVCPNKKTMGGKE